jgi:type VI secretion system protein ImpG
VNIFPHPIQPIILNQAKFEYRVVPADSSSDGFEIYSIQEVTGLDPEQGETVTYRPFYSIDQTTGRSQREAFWHTTRKPSANKDDIGTEIYINLVDRGWDPIMPATSTLDVRGLCTNRQLAAVLQRAGDQLNLEIEMAAPLAGIQCVRAPTLPQRPPRRDFAYWRLLSHLNLNHLSLIDNTQGAEALRDLLRLYNFAEESGENQAEMNSLMIDGLISVKSRRVVGRIGDGAAAGFARGVEVTLDLDEDKFVGTGAFLFASVMERFLGLYTTMNSFTQLVAKARQGDRVIKKWPPRSGNKTLL